jgi:hypothetical protein
MTPDELEVMGHAVRSWFMSDCAPSRAVEERTDSMGSGETGLVSRARRFPRSKV